jgi:hypothetical protein
LRSDANPKYHHPDTQLTPKDMPFTANDTYAEFVKSPAYTKWKNAQAK